MVSPALFYHFILFYFILKSEAVEDMIFTMHKRLTFSTIIVLTVFTLFPQEGITLMKLTSRCFNNGQYLPAKYTYGDQNCSPEFSWSGIPHGTKSLVLINDDPDAPSKTWTHWVIYNMPPTMTQLEEGIPHSLELPTGCVQGKNDFGDIGYDGAYPPPGKVHRYVFTLYAMKIKLALPPGKTRKDVLKAMEGHILETAELTALYQR